MDIQEFDCIALAKEYDSRHPGEILKLALESFDNLAISFSGAEDVVLVDMAVKLKPDVQVFSLDTGRLHAYTYCLLEQVRDHIKINI